MHRGGLKHGGLEKRGLKIFKQRSNDVRSLGKELLEILEGFTGWSPSITKDAMIACRDILGLGVDERVLVVDGRDGSFA